MTDAARAAAEKEMHELFESMQKARSRMVELGRELAHGVVPDYQLRGEGGAPVALSSLFAGKQDLIVIQNMGRRCPYCTLWADGLSGLLPHLEDRAAIVLVSPDEPEVQREFAASRGWGYRMLSSGGTTFKHDLGFANDKQQQMPGVSVFRRDPDGKIRNVAKDYFGPGDVYCALWPLFELLEGGPGEWQPKFSYAPCCRGMQRTPTARS